QEVADIMEDALAHAGENYNTTIPIHNSLGALGKTDALKNYIHREIAIYEEHLKKVPEDARARVLLAADYAKQDRFEEAKREADMAMILRPDDSMILYNTACVFCEMKNAGDALIAIKKAWESGYRDATWTRQDPDLALLHGDPEFERLYPPPKA
ncbi:MAG TPA: protein kinase, partial [Blastocatellia bacterium]|nr:protein kinase [Blastocatellia bacterium]